MQPDPASTGLRPAEAAMLRALDGDREYLARYLAVTSLSRRVRSSEYLLTNACNIRCAGCWFFENEFDTATKELTQEPALREFARRERARGVNYAIIIGGEPTLIPKRVGIFVEEMEYVTISTNGLRPMPMQGFERVGVQISVFGGGAMDDELRAIRPGGARFTGLFDSALSNYRNDPRACFVFAICDETPDLIEPTVRRIHDNGNRVSFNLYSRYGATHPLRLENAPRLLAAAIETKERYPSTVLSHPYFIEALVTGRVHWGETFSYDVCPSISVDHPAHRERLASGRASLPLFNAWAADCETVNFCCTSGHCEDCRDSQAILSWLQVSMNRFRDSPQRLKTWIEIAESYWHQFPWATTSAAKAPVARRTLPLSS